MHSFFDAETIFGLGTIVLFALLLRSFLKTLNIGLGLMITVIAIEEDFKQFLVVLLVAVTAASLPKM
jgi:hypothetical protein